MAGPTTFLKVKNRAYSKLAAAISAAALTVDVTAGEGSKFPSTYPFHITIEDEILEVTDVSTDTLTFTRAAQGTSAAAHPNKAYVALNITAKSVTDLNTAVNFIEKYADYALAFYGVITTIDNVTHFRVAGLAGMGTGWFKPVSGTPYEIYVLQADGAAPEGEQTPVVSYTSTGGIFEHAELGGAFAEGDEVMIVMPLLASLGTKATGAATGAVSTAKYAMAYMKQVVTLLLNATYGLAAIKTYVSVTLKNVVTETHTAVHHANYGLSPIKSYLINTINASHTYISQIVTETHTRVHHVNYGLQPIKEYLINTINASHTYITQIVTESHARLHHVSYGLQPIKEYLINTINASHTYISQIVTETHTRVHHVNYGLQPIKEYLINTINASHTYISQIVTEAHTAIHHATYGLSALKTLIGAKNATATAADLSDIATTDLSAKVRRLLLRFSSGAFDVSLDGSSRTDLDALYTALGVLLGTRDATVSAGVLADDESAMALLRRIATSGSLVHFGDITAVSAGVSSTIPDLIGWEDDYFLGWWMMIVRDNGGAGAAPQGEYRQISSYTSSSGLMNHTAFSTADVAGDQAMLIHPLLYAMFAATRGSGVESLESIDDELDAMPDMAEVRTLASPVTLTNTYQYIHTESPGRPFYFAGGFVSRASGAWTTESVEIVVEVKFDGTNWREVWAKTITAEPSPLGLGVPADANSALLNIPKGFWNNGDGVRVGIKQSIEDGGYHTWAHSFLNAVVGT